jgi:membrane-bound lytic murein transglycosylase D
MRQTTGKERGTDADFWKIAQRLPRETRNYVPLMLAAGHIGKEPAKYGFTSVEYQQPVAYSNVHVPGGVALSTIAKAAGVSEDLVDELNPQFLRGITPPKRTSVVRVPEGSELRFAQAFETVLREDQQATAQLAKAAAASKRYYTVRRGDNLSEIADRHDISVKRLKSLNGLRGSLIRPGQRLRVA